MFLLYSAMDENFSWYLDDSINAMLNNRSVDKLDEDFMESNVMRCEYDIFVNAGLYNCDGNYDTYMCSGSFSFYSSKKE